MTAMTETIAEDDPPLTHLRLTARLNTSALDYRRGVVRLHPEAIAALGIREWDAVVAHRCADHRRGGRGGPARHARRAPRCSTTSRCPTPGCAETTTVIVAPVTVYGARSVTVSRLEPGHPVDLVGHAAPGAARQGDDGRRHRVAAAARPRSRHPDVGGHRGAGVVGRHHLDLGAADRHRRRPGGTGQRATEFGGQLGRRHVQALGRRTATARTAPSVRPPPTQRRAGGQRRRPQGRAHAQAGRLTEWLKLALDEPELLETLGATANLGVLVSGSGGRRQGHHGAGGVRRATARRTRRARGRRAARRGPAAAACPSAVATGPRRRRACC